ncbi:MAG: uncharacterized protein HW421_3078 [Ignavibacteria bacterium]|nr:uncharacterized protein [Ignavibacteria bacterium]
MKKFTILIAYILICISIQSEAKDDLIPKLLEARESGYQGMEFWFSVPPPADDYIEEGLNITLHIFSAETAKVFIEIPKAGYLRYITVKPNVVYDHNIIPEVACPYFKAKDASIPKDILYKNAGIHIYTNKPISIFVNINNNNEGFVPLPVMRLGKEYICSSYNTEPYFEIIGFKNPVMTCITATEDNTDVKFVMGGNPASITTIGLKPGQSTSSILSKGDVLVFNSGGGYGDLAGSKITSSKPVSVITGSQANNIPSGNFYYNYCVESELPTELWGLNYYIPQINGRRWPSLMRIFAKEPNTKIFRDGKSISFIKSAGGIMGDGFQETRINPMDQAQRPVVISGDKPIKVMFYNTGIEEDAKADSSIFPFWMSVIPDDLFQTEATFFAPGNDRIILIYQTDSNSLMPQDISFGSFNSNGYIKWENLSKKFPSIDEQFQYDIDNKHYAQRTIPLPGKGLYKIIGNQPFGLYSYGFNYDKAYGYPSGISLPMIIDSTQRADTSPPLLSYTVDCDGFVNDGKAVDKPDIISVCSNLNSAYMLKDSSYNYYFNSSKIDSGKTKSIDWTLEVIDKNKNARAVLFFIDNRNNFSKAVVEYKAKIILANLESVNTKYTSPGINEHLVIAIKNIGPTNIYELFALLKNGNTGFTNPLTISALKIPLYGTFKLDVWFSSVQLGLHRDTVVIYDTCRIYENIPIDYLVHGGTDSMIIPEATPFYIDFGKVLPDNVVQRQIKLHNPNAQFMAAITKIDFKSKQNYFYTSAKTPLEIFPLENQDYSINFKSKNIGIYYDTLCLGNSITNSCPVIVRAVATTILDNEEEFNTTYNEVIYGIRIIPQPVSGNGIISFSNSKPVTLTIRLTDLFGNNALSILNKSLLESGQQEIHFDAESLSQGIYFLEIFCEGNRYVRKFVVVK